MKPTRGKFTIVKRRNTDPLLIRNWIVYNRQCEAFAFTSWQSAMFYVTGQWPC